MAQTVTVAVALSVVRPQLPVARTQKVDVDDGDMVNEEPVAPAIGLPVLPLVPEYH